MRIVHTMFSRRNNNVMTDRRRRRERITHNEWKYYSRVYYKLFIVAHGVYLVILVVD